MTLMKSWRAECFLLLFDRLPCSQSLLGSSLLDAPSAKGFVLAVPWDGEANWNLAIGPVSDLWVAPSLRST